MSRRRRTVVALTVALLALLPAVALAHVERTSYWPDPRPDTSISPAAGGHVPKARSLASALKRSKPGHTRVVCQRRSLRRVRAAVRRVRANGYRLRPSEPLRHLSRRAAKRLIRVNKRLAKRCRFHAIQPAVTASGNQDRVVVMPGTYTEKASRAVESLPKECDQYRTSSDRGSGAVSYTYQAKCPNAVNLVAVIGRKLGPGEDPQAGPTGRPDPHGIPNLGPCIRCNLQLEGSGPTPDDVVLGAGNVAAGNHGPRDSKKDVGLRADRADGFVVRNMTFRHAAEHDVYVHEIDGYRMDRVKFFYAGEYGALMFTSDHGLTQNCEGVGNGDSAVYPGAGPDTGTERDTSYYPEQRVNQTITHCDLHHNNLGYSGTMGNGVRVVDNDFYDNTAGIATDSFFAGGHPGYPEDSSIFEGNRIYSNNFNVYAEGSDVESAVPVPIGVGILIAGGNDNIVRNNQIYDNWRRGTMLISVPDVISCAPNPAQGAAPCTPQGTATVSNGNRYSGNVMSRSPDGKPAPNGVDFWWDEFPTNHDNCWYPNTGADGTQAGVTSDPPAPPVAGASLPGFMPQDCSGNAPGSTGIGDPAKEAVLVGCVADFAASRYDAPGCDWFQMPERPGTAAAARQRRSDALSARRAGEQVQLQRFCTLLGGRGGTLACAPFSGRP